MAIIKSGNSTDEMIVHSVAKAARIAYYDINNNVISNKQTFRACTAAGSSITENNNTALFLSIFGSSTKTVRVLKITLRISKIASTNLILLASKRSTPNTGGSSNSTDLTSSSIDSKNIIPTATTKIYNNSGGTITPGTLVGVIETRRVLISIGGSLRIDEVVFDFTDQSSITHNMATLRGTSQGIDISYAVNPGADIFVNATIEWTEE